VLSEGFDRARFGCINQPGAGSLNQRSDCIDAGVAARCALSVQLGVANLCDSLHDAPHLCELWSESRNGIAALSFPG
jgi:hypothetical protein